VSHTVSDKGTGEITLYGENYLTPEEGKMKNNAITLEAPELTLHSIRRSHIRARNVKNRIKLSTSVIVIHCENKMVLNSKRLKLNGEIIDLG